MSDREAIWQYIATDDPHSADRVDASLESAIAELTEFPGLGKPGLIARTRELAPIHNYRVVYEISGQEVWILAIMHTSRLWP